MNAWGLADIGRAPRGLGVTRGCQQGSLVRLRHSCPIYQGVPSDEQSLRALVGRTSGISDLLCPCGPSPPPAFAAGCGAWARLSDSCPRAIAD